MPAERARNPPCTAAVCAAYSKACRADNRSSRRNGLIGSRCVLLMQVIDRSSHSVTLSNRHIRPECGMSVRISALLIDIANRFLTFHASSEADRN